MMIIGMSSCYEEVKHSIETKAGNITLYKVGADWCAPCVLMDRTFFNQSEIQYLLEQYNSFKKIDIDSQEGKKIASKYGIKSIPCLIMIDDNGKELGRKSGYTKSNYRTYREWLRNQL